MSKRIGEVFSKIYRGPSAGASRQVLTLSRGDAESLPLMSGVAMISITAPEQLPANLPDYEFLLRLSFSDVDFLSNELSPRAAAKIASALTREQAAHLLQFVTALPESIHTLVVHCSGGYSRSPGVASALGAIYGYGIENDRMTDANQSVRTLLLEVANHQPKSRRREKCR